ncbi:MAG: HAD family hydrolase [Alphaproteobacteria bacterium]|nr:MAG: HAD family hydrolase [Alphaproteobacteria bacterium]
MALNLPRPRAILFDWDNTLVDTWPIIYKALHDTMQRWNMTPWTLEEVKLKVGKSMRDSFPEMFGEAWEEAGDFYLAAYRSYHLEQLVALPGAVRMLDAVRAYAPYVGVVSNKRGDSLRIEVAHMGWNHYFDVLVGAGDALRDKPYADPALFALQGSGIEAGRDVWFVGDTTTDLECARACGMTAILYGDVQPESTAHYLGVPYHLHVRDHDAFIHALV